MTFIPQLNKKKCYVPCSQDKVKAGLCDCHNLLSTSTLTDKKSMIEVNEIFNKNLNFDLRCDKELQEKINEWIANSSKELITEVLKEAADCANLQGVRVLNSEDKPERYPDRIQDSVYEQDLSNQFGARDIIWKVNKESITSVIDKFKF